MAEFYQLNYGDQVRFFKGPNKDTEGCIVYGDWRNGLIGISTSRNPELDRPNFVASPSELEIVATECHLKPEPPHSAPQNPFEYHRMILTVTHPKLAADNPGYFGNDNALVAARILNSKRGKKRK